MECCCSSTVPLALTILGPVIVSILAYHLLMDPKGLPLAIIVTVLWFILFFRYKQKFSGIFAARQLEPPRTLIVNMR